MELAVAAPRGLTGRDNAPGTAGEVVLLARCIRVVPRERSYSLPQEEVVRPCLRHWADISRPVLAALVVFCFSSVYAQPAADPSLVPADPVAATLSRSKDKNPMARLKAVSDLASAGGDSRAIPALMDRLADENTFVRAAAADSLGLLRAVQARGRIAEMMVNDKDPQVRQGAAIALSYMADASLEPQLLQALKDPFEGVRFSAVRVLGSIRSAKAVPILSDLLNDKNPEMRRTAADALTAIGSRSAGSALAPALKDPDPKVRIEAARGIGATGDSASTAALRGLLKDPDVQVRIQAAISLGNLKDDSGAPIGLDLLKNDAPALRQQGAAILGMVGDRDKALRALKEAAAAEKDPATKQSLEFARNRVKSRFGIKEEPAESSEPPSGNMRSVPPAGSTTFPEAPVKSTAAASIGISRKKQAAGTAPRAAASSGKPGKVRKKPAPSSPSSPAGTKP